MYIHDSDKTPRRTARLLKFSTHTCAARACELSLEPSPRTCFDMLHYSMRRAIWSWDVINHSFHYFNASGLKIIYEGAYEGFRASSDLIYGRPLKMLCACCRRLRTYVRDSANFRPDFSHVNRGLKRMLKPQKIATCQPFKLHDDPKIAKLCVLGPCGLIN